MNEAGFRNMLGFLGKSFIGERMYHVTKPQNDKLISLEDYLVYQDKVMHGTTTEKNDISFRMLDMSNSGQVTYETYEKFWSSFLYMYGEMFNYKVNIDETDKNSAKQTFNIISQGAESFDFALFEKAKSENPQLLEWIDEPENYLK